MSKLYSVVNGAIPGAAADAGIATNTAIRTLMQIATNTTNNAIRVVEWWAEYNGTVANTPITTELLGHAGGAQTTLTAYAAGDITKVNDPNAPTTSIQLGTALSGFSNTTTEVTPTTVRNFSTHFVPPTSGIYIQYPLGREPEVPVAAFLRVRVTAGANVQAMCGVTWEE